jgi:hypothetical protein
MEIQSNLIGDPLIKTDINDNPSMIKGKRWISDRPIDQFDYENFWTKKRKGAYLLGCGRWFRVCR